MLGNNILPAESRREIKVLSKGKRQRFNLNQSAPVLASF